MPHRLECRSEEEILSRIDELGETFITKGHIGIMPDGQVLFQILPIVDHLDSSSEKEEYIPIIIDKGSPAQSLQAQHKRSYGIGALGA